MNLFANVSVRERTDEEKEGYRPEMNFVAACSTMPVMWELGGTAAEALVAKYKDVLHFKVEGVSFL